MRPATAIFHDRHSQGGPFFRLQFVYDPRSLRVQVGFRLTLVHVLTNLVWLNGLALVFACVPAAVIFLKGPTWLNITALICPGSICLLLCLLVLCTIPKLTRSLVMAFHGKVWAEISDGGFCTVIGGRDVRCKPKRVLLLRDSTPRDSSHSRSSYVDVLLEDTEGNYTLLWIVDQGYNRTHERANLAALRTWASHAKIAWDDASASEYQDAVTTAFEL